MRVARLVRLCIFVIGLLGALSSFHGSASAAAEPGSPSARSIYVYDSPSMATTPGHATRTDTLRRRSAQRTLPGVVHLDSDRVRAAKGETTLYRAVSDAELDDIAKNGLRVNPSGRGYQTEKLFTGSAEDAARQAQIAHKLSGQVSTIIEARFPSGVDILRGRADSMDIFSVPAGSLSRGRLSHVFRDASPRP